MPPDKFSNEFRTFIASNAANFFLNYHGVGNAKLTNSHFILHCNTFCLFGNPQLSAILKVSSTRKECDVDLALRLDVLAVCAVFAFVGAILLGAF